MTDEGKAALIKHEGEVLHAYQCPTGHWTIGVGHSIDERNGGGISQRISRLLLDDDLTNCTLQARQTFPWFDTLDPVRQDVVVQMIFNCGLAGFQGFKDCITAIAQHDWHTAALELADSEWAKQVGPQRTHDLTYALEHGHWEHPNAA
jgi:lysozyme